MSEQPQAQTGPVVIDEEALAAKRQPKKSAVAALVGSALEYYDFFIYASASALVFNVLFFDQSNPAMATILSLATFGVAYIARPLGAIVLGRWGDRSGRKNVMIFTLFMMGFATIAIGCLPTYGQIGVLAPVLLVVCRLIQGFSAGGETAVDAQDPRGLTPDEHVFEIRLGMENPSWRMLPGQVVVMRFAAADKPLLLQAWRALQQLLQRRFHV